MIAPGERVLVAGESGTGKSTLVRAIAGLWPWGEGDIQVESGAKMLLMPQRAYVPAGSLRRAATYPEPADSKEIDEVAKALKQVGLGHLVDRLDEEAPWDQTLSGGEKQRLAFARILLHRPDIIVLDEATSALDPDEPGQADGAADEGAQRNDDRQRRPSTRARGVPQPQDHSRAPPRRRQVRHRHSTAARPTDQKIAAAATRGVATARFGSRGQHFFVPHERSILHRRLAETVASLCDPGRLQCLPSTEDLATRLHSRNFS